MLFGIPPILATAIFSALPLFELRVGLPYGLWAGIPLHTTFPVAVIANSLAAILFYFLLDPIVRLARAHWSWLDRLIQKIFDRTRKEHTKSFNRFGALFLIVFISVPIPGSGSYTAAVIAYLFGLPPKTAAISLTLGTLGSGFAVLGLTGAWLAMTKFW